MEVQIRQSNKDIDKNRESGLYPIADKDFITIQLDQDSTLKDIRDKLSEKLQVNNESLKLYGMTKEQVRSLGIRLPSRATARIPATEEKDIYLFKTREEASRIREPWPNAQPRFGLDSLIHKGELFTDVYLPPSFSFEIIHSPTLREHVELLKSNKRLAYSKMNEKFDDIDVFREVTKYLKGGKKKRRKKRKTKGRRKSKKNSKSKSKNKSRTKRKNL
tara:strand:+ start:110 stop:763 length:654 start_codon:yes stop_codon:yes gene_type:complete